MNTYTPAEGQCCDHDWKLQDDSFDHEFGTESIHYWLCTKCEATKDIEAEDFGEWYDEL